MRVRASKSFSAYIGSQIIAFEKGEEVQGDLALALVQASCAVEILDDPAGSLAEASEFHPDGAPATLAVEAADPAAAEDSTDAAASGEPDVPAEVPTRVVARSDFRTYDGANVIDVHEGQEFTGALAAALADAGVDVEVVETGLPEGAQQPAAETSTPDPDPKQGAQDPAGDSGDDDPADFDPADHTVDEVRAYLRNHPDQRDAVRAAELAGKARTTLLTELSD